jgi:hypothetical protein
MLTVSYLWFLPEFFSSYYPMLHWW